MSFERKIRRKLIKEFHRKAPKSGHKVYIVKSGYSGRIQYKCVTCDSVFDTGICSDWVYQGVPVYGKALTCNETIIRDII